ncbi:hypothetical protein ['Paenibacillus yunnanensis' Narsing Rao et al. 2020]|uniref:hypothetical protein n=1 Tax=Paenibacillus tengchongensis TaxID=2608684 RepID=UPI001652563F|nr:hypothetical protein [Paenibacillus tengchongensis]
MITTYTQHAHILSILTCYENTYPWIFSNYIQLFINKDYKHNWGDFYFPIPYELRPSDTCRYLISQKIDREVILKKWDSVIDFIIENIDSNYYVHIMMNYFYVPVSDRYKNVHKSHDMFVYGYDLDRRIFYISDFFKDGVYSQEEISFSDFDLAFTKKNLTNNPDYLNGMVYLYKFNKEFEYDFSIEGIINSINNYLFNEIPEYWKLYNYHNQINIDFGMQIYSTLKNYVNNTSDNEGSLDIRPFYLLYEHKRIATLRMKYLHENQHLGKMNCGFIDNFSLIEAQAKITTNHAIKYNLTNNKHILERMNLLLTNLEKEESKCLNQFLDDYLNQ